MPSSPSQHYKHRLNNNHKHPRLRTHPTHHGKHQSSSADSSLLLGLPSESITHVTSYLDPPALFTLSQTCQAFYRHINDDNTWRRAFFCQFLHTSPEDMIQDDFVHTNSLMLRRSEGSWQKEFVCRWNLRRWAHSLCALLVLVAHDRRRRWERTRSSSTISHIPVHSTVSEIHLLNLDRTTSSQTVLLAASLSYGVVARSQPLTGKIAKGFLDAAGTRNGLGNGNPNAEFSPNLAQCAITSTGATAKVLWAFKNGVVAVTVSQKVADLSKPSHAQWRRCREQEAHTGSIEHAIWVNVNGSSSRFFATAGVDGYAKLWDADQMRCLWTSSQQVGAVGPDSCSRIAVNALHGMVAVLHRSGLITLWRGLPILDDVRPGDDTPFHTGTLFATYASQPRITEHRSVLAFAFRMITATRASVLTAYEREAIIYKTVIDLDSGYTQHIMLGNESFGEITAVEPIFPLGDTCDERAFVLAGDIFGYAMIFAWDEEQNGSQQSFSDIASVTHLHRFPVFNDTPISALHWNYATFTAGSAVGALKVFDATRLDQLREFKLPFVRTLTSRDAVTRIDVVRDILVATVDNRVYAWRGEPPGNSKNVRGKKTIRMPNNVAKWHREFLFVSGQWSS
jgi:WD40 repeat protein